MISEVFNEDCLIGMKRYPDKFFELAICDPPYGIDITQGFDITKSERPNHKRNVEAGYKKYIVKDWDDFVPEKEYWDELFRVSKNQVVWGANYFTNYLPPSKGWFFWDKGADYEASFNFSHGELAFTSFEKRLMKYFVSPKSETNGGKDKIHPTQKPVRLYRWILKTYGKEGDKLLDTHMGSQSSRIAAFNMGFDYWGWEIDKEYFDKGNKRFKEQTMQMKLL